MKILIDTLDLNEIKKYSELGIISGTTTNPTFSKRFGMKDDLDTIKQVAEAQDGVGEIYIEAFGDTARFHSQRLEFVQLRNYLNQSLELIYIWSFH